MACRVGQRFLQDPKECNLNRHRVAPAERFAAATRGSDSRTLTKLFQIMLDAGSQTHFFQQRRLEFGDKSFELCQSLTQFVPQRVQACDRDLRVIFQKRQRIFNFHQRIREDLAGSIHQCVRKPLAFFFLQLEKSGWIEGRGVHGESGCFHSGLTFEYSIPRGVAQEANCPKSRYQNGAWTRFVL